MASDCNAPNPPSSVGPLGTQLTVPVTKAEPKPHGRRGRAAARLTRRLPRRSFDRGGTPLLPTALPEHWASFLLVPAGALTALEILAGPGAATYVFRAGVEEVNRDLQALHFRRAPLALTAGQAEVTPANPHRLALRRLEPLRRLRASTTARLMHNEGWTAALARALGAR